MTLHSLPLFVRLDGRPVILLGEGEPAAAKGRLLARAGAVPVGEDADAALAIVAIPDEAEALAAIARLKARGVLVNAVDRPAQCDFTLPAIVDRDPVIVAIGTGGVSAGLAAALRQRLETLLPARLGALAQALNAARGPLRQRFPDMADRRRAISGALAPGGTLDPLALPEGDLDTIAATIGAAATASRRTIRLRSADPDDLTLREARWLADADWLVAGLDAPSAILARARADAGRSATPPIDATGLVVTLIAPGAAS